MPKTDEEKELTWEDHLAAAARRTAAALALDEAQLALLQELGESINAETLVQAAEANPQLAFVQRLGWLLDKAGFEAVTGKLRDWLGKRGVKPVVLDTAQPAKGFPRDPKWSVIVNTEVEGDL